jgi:hypothetical protein
MPTSVAEPPFWPWPEEFTTALFILGGTCSVVLLAAGIILVVVVRRR